MKRFLLALAALAACSPPAPRTVRVGAASSLRDLLTPGVAGFLVQEMPMSVSLSFDASSTLSRQVEAGGALDVVLSADGACIDRLGNKVVRSTRRVFLTNRLALIGPEGTSGLESVPANAKISIAGPEVPAGKAWRKYLGGTGRLAALEGRLATADSVRGALALFDSKAVDYALVYATDAQEARRAHAAWAPPDGPVTEYVAAVVAAHDTAWSRAFVEWLGSAGFQAEARKLGFGAPPK
ncbi:MAG: molybdate transport system substrate-binding [Planctomycetota bacterium]|nr:MAG: molybdate transport system substrate-binding [Planctomycetota bacterium]